MDGVQCPYCKELGTLNAIVKRGEYYFCADIKCTLFEDRESLEILVYNQTEKFLEKPLNIYGNEVILNCPLCAAAGKQKTILKREDCYLCEDKSCLFIETIDSYNNFGGAETVKESNDYINERPDSIDNVLAESKYLNWVKLPFNFDASYSILFALFIHLDIFEHKNTNAISSLLREYRKCNTFVNNNDDGNIELFAFNFISKLNALVYDMFTTVTTDNSINDQFLSILNNYLEKHDFFEELKVVYEVTISCDTCKRTEIVRYREYLIPLQCKYLTDNFSRNTISCTIDCSLCKGPLNKSLVLTEVPRLVMFQCTNGVEDVTNLDQLNIVDRNCQPLRLTAVVECKEKGLLNNASQTKAISIFDYNNRLISDNTVSSFTIHFQDNFGWHSIGPDKGLICSTSKDLCVNNVSDVRFLIFGSVTDQSSFEYSLNGSIHESNEVFVEENLKIEEKNDMKKINGKEEMFDTTSDCSRKRKSQSPLNKSKVRRTKILETVDMDDDDYYNESRDESYSVKSEAKPSRVGQLNNQRKFRLELLDTSPEVFNTSHLMDTEDISKTVTVRAPKSLPRHCIIKTCNEAELRKDHRDEVLAEKYAIEVGSFNDERSKRTVSSSGIFSMCDSEYTASECIESTGRNLCQGGKRNCTMSSSALSSMSDHTDVNKGHVSESRDHCKGGERIHHKVNSLFNQHLNSRHKVDGLSNRILTMADNQTLVPYMGQLVSHYLNTYLIR